PGCARSGDFDSRRPGLAGGRGLPRQYGLHLDPRAPGLDVPEPVRRRVRKVDDAIGAKRTAVVDAHDDRSPVAEMGHARVARYRQDRVRRGHRVHVVTLAARGALALESAAVPASESALAVGVQRTDW